MGGVGIDACVCVCFVRVGDASADCEDAEYGCAECCDAACAGAAEC